MAFKSRLPYFIATSVFSKELFGFQVMGSVVDIYQVGLACFGLLSLIDSRRALKVLGAWSVVLVFSWVLLETHGYPVDVLLKQGVVAAVVYAGFAVLLSKTSPSSLLEAYLNVCFIAAAFGLVQFFLSLGGVSVLMKTPGRLDSLTYEPSHYAIAIAPAAYLSILSLWKKRKLSLPRELVILASMVCTVSFTALMILLISGLVIGLRGKGAPVVVVVLLLVFLASTNQDYLPDEIRIRVEALSELDDNQNVAEIKNLTVFSAVSNWNVAVDTLMKGRVFGNGFGGHSYAYEHFYGDQSRELGDRYGVNLLAGHSLFIRIFSELGILGAFFYLWWVLVGVKSASDLNGIWWTLGAVYLIGRVFKLGGFFEVGMPIFMVAPFVYTGWMRIKPSVSRRRSMRSRNVTKE